MKAGIYYDLSNEDYHNSDGISKTGLDDINKNPALYKRKLDARKSGKLQTDTKVFREGRVAHVAVLEPHRFKELYHIEKTITRRNNEAWERLQRIHAPKEIITVSEYDEAMFISEAVYAEPKARSILTKGEAEVSFYVIDEQTGELVKVRLDWFVEGVAADFKTTKDASKEAFAKACYNYRYFVQAPFYMDTAGKALQRTFENFLFICCEKQTYQVAVYNVAAPMIHRGRAAYRKNLQTYADCKRSGNWHGYNEGNITTIDLPEWANRKLDAELFLDSETF